MCRGTQNKKVMSGVNLLFSIFNFQKNILFKIQIGDFPSGPVVKNPPANSGDIELIPDLARSHMSRSN